jgi:hypothetical protein
MPLILFGIGWEIGEWLAFHTDEFIEKVKEFFRR